MSRKCLKCGHERLSSDLTPEYECPKCNAIYDKVEAVLKVGGIDYGETKKKNLSINIPFFQSFKSKVSNLKVSTQPVPKNTKLILGLLGSLILFLGVFTPIVSFPIIGNINYFHNGKGDGVYILGLATISIILILYNKYKGLIVTGLVSIGVLLYTFYKLQNISSEMTSKQEELANIPLGNFLNIATQSIQIQWGFAVLFIGAVFLLASAMLKEQK